MLNKLAYRNMKRSARDYLVYILTMTLVTALMYAADSLFFQNELADSMYFSMEGLDVMTVMIALATFFIVLIVAWLINYMVRFMLEKRSTEFGIYLLLGMKKRTVSRLYLRENILLGTFSFLLGCVLGILLQQILLTVMYSMVKMEYHMHISFSRGTLLMTLLCYACCYLVALLRCRHRFRKMNIQALMNAKSQNEEIREKHEALKQLLLPLSVVFLLLFWALFGSLAGTGEILLFLVGLVLTIYLFYTGLSAWIICYVRKKGNGIYRGQNLFLLRQFASKVRTMQFTLGTLTSLYTLALMGASCALMLSTFENTILDDKFPFDVQMFNGDPQYDFRKEMDIMEAMGVEGLYYSYQIYTDHQNQAGAWLLTNLKSWKDTYCRENGAGDMPKILAMLSQENIYYPNDTYMGLSDYNRLRSMLGYGQIPLKPGEYLIQAKSRLCQEIQKMREDLRITDASGRELLACAGVVGDPFCQDGHNGADYLIVVPDAVLERMTPYYAELAVDIRGEVPRGLQEALDALEKNQESMSSFLERFEESAAPETGETQLCIGSDNIVTYAGTYLVRDTLIPFLKYLLSTLILPLFYLGLVFVCVAMTVLSVQQLSDSAKYKFRYDVLARLGLERGQIRRLILKQLAAYYLCPALLAMVISGKMILFVSGKFVELSGVPASTGDFFLRTTALFFGIYLVYFIVTYVGFQRNIEERRR